MKVIFFFCLLLGLLPSIAVQGQSYSPTFMVVPIAKTGQDLIEVYENDANYQRMITALVQEGLLKNGATTIDFHATYKDLEARGIFRDVQRDELKTSLLDNSTADIYVEIEVQPSENLTELIIKAYDAFTKELLSTKSCSSTQRLSKGSRSVFVDALSKSDNSGSVIRPGSGPPVEGNGGWGSTGGGGMVVLNSFLDMTRNAFAEFVNEGQMINVEFNIGDNCIYDFFEQAKNTASGEENDLATIIEEWIMQPAIAKQSPRINPTDNAIQARNMRIPVLKERGGEMRRYTPSLFASDVLKFCRTIRMVDAPD